MTTDNQNDPNDIAFVNFDEEIESDEDTSNADEAIVNFLSYDFASALDELNQERADLYGKKEKEKENSTQSVEFSIDIAKDCIKKRGITFFLNMVKAALDESGYTQFGDAQFMHPKSGILTRL